MKHLAPNSERENGVRARHPRIAALTLLASGLIAVGIDLGLDYSLLPHAPNQQVTIHEDLEIIEIAAASTVLGALSGFAILATSVAIAEQQQNQTR